MEPSFQEMVGAWLRELCGADESSFDSVERSHRFLEESLETVQANGCSRLEAHRLVDYVYDRPAGELLQEVGGALTTLAALCFVSGINMQEAGDTELRRVTLNINKIRVKRDAKRHRELALREQSPLP